MIFEWDDEKERKNIIKHGIDFETAAHVFSDINRIEIYDESHSEFEDRYIILTSVNIQHFSFSDRQFASSCLF